MKLFLIFLFFLALCAVIQSRLVVGKNQRAVVFYLGRYKKILPTGTYYLTPWLHSATLFDLNKYLAGWQTMNDEAINQAVLEQVLNTSNRQHFK